MSAQDTEALDDGGAPPAVARRRLSAGASFRYRVPLFSWHFGPGSGRLRSGPGARDRPAWRGLSAGPACRRADRRPHRAVTALTGHTGSAPDGQWQRQAGGHSQVGGTRAPQPANAQLTRVSHSCGGDPGLDRVPGCATFNAGLSVLAGDRRLLRVGSRSELVRASPGVLPDGQAALVHDGDALGAAGHGAVVGDQDEGQAEVAP